jgi:HAD-superfamily hydrolase, subfamily IA, variant 3
MIKNIIFDIGGVLAEPKSGHWFITTNFWNILNKNLIDEEKLKISLKKYLYLQTQEPKTEKDEHKMFSNYYCNVLKDINYPNASLDIANKLADDCVYNDDKFIFFDDVYSILEELSKKYNLYIISNGWPSSFRVLKNKGIDKYFKGIIISSMYTTVKEENLFDIFINKYKEVTPSESLYIDDRNHILQKAKEYGFNLLLMDRYKKYEKTQFEIVNNMNDILKILE